ncbi:MAG: hypothetical protein SPJ84_02685 [Fusobacterium gastrosuis]|uniref:hypothetical protein n=1 Tax=Fusobacterium TaxID=848 RepID=UPI0025BC938E|nr:hypothetical protein [Fusobacterium sp.]MCI7224323.1 hypothetical protein [Fusobacterium sp.]MDY5794711.1 hypothetical protein [Fusobacterium gastrosuis]
MDNQIIQEFKGVINGVECNDRYIYCSLEFLLEKIEEKFGKMYNQDFVKDLKENIERMNQKYEEFSFATLESEFSNAIGQAETFNKIEFTYYGSDWKIEKLNENIRSNKYSISNENINTWVKRKNGIGIVD